MTTPLAANLDIERFIQDIQDRPCNYNKKIFDEIPFILILLLKVYGIEITIAIKVLWNKHGLIYPKCISYQV